MAILQECPRCHKKQSNKNKICKKCEHDLDKAKNSGTVRYWVSYRVDGKQKREAVGAIDGLKPNSIEDARTAESKVRVLLKEGKRKLLEALPESKMSFEELASWYLELEAVKALKSFWLIELCISKFNKVFGDKIVGDIKPSDLTNYQVKRKKAKKAPATIDHEIGKVKTMIIKAFDDGLVSGDVLRTFKKCKKTLKKGSDVRNRILSKDEYKTLMSNLSSHLKPIIAMGYHTGMRRGEILNLTWDRIDMKNKVIRLTGEDTKDSEARTIPICNALYDRLNKIRGIHGHVFKYRGKPIANVRRGLKDACDKSDIVYGRFKKNGFVFHDLRHTFNTNMRKAGVPESVIMAITGHSTREMFDRYNTVDENDMKKAIDQLEAYL